MGTRLVSLATLTALALGCEASPRSAEAPRVEASRLSVVALEDGSLELRWDEAVRLRFEADAFQLGVVDALEERFNYDPWYVFEGPVSSLPRGLEWRVPETVEAEVDGATLVVGLRYAGLGEATLSMWLEEDRVVADLRPPEGNIAYFRLRPRVDEGEGFYGLGSALDTPEHRGKVRALQIEVDLGLESGVNEANVPIPLLIGTRGWGLFIEDDHPMVFDVAAGSAEHVDAYVGTGLASGEGLRFHLFAADHPLDITRGYFAVTGQPRLPAPWALGPWLWRDENRDQAEVESDLETMRALDLAATGLWVDRPYASGVSSFDFRPSQFPDPGAMIERAHELGFRFALWHTAYVGEGQEATATLHAEAEAEGYYPVQSGPLLSRWGRLVDLTNPDAYAWWQSLVRRYTELGVEGFKLDYVQEIVAGIGRVRTVWTFADGSTERTMHKRYQALYHQVFAETLPASGGFLLTRTGVYGDQRNGVIIWPGDLDSTMERHRAAATDRHNGEEYVAVGGLPASMVLGLSLGPSGFPFYGSDTGGYRHCPPDKETFTRWFQQTALSSVMQIGTSCNDVAWAPTEANGFDEALLEGYRRYTRLHLRLWPYLWTLAHHHQRDGRPIQRPFGLQHPELGMHPWDVYFLGDALLVAPVLSHGARARVVPFPPGDWFDWWTGERVSGGVDVEVAAPLDTLPLYLRGGGIVPLLRPTIDTLSAVADPDRIDSFATDTGRLHARIAAGPPGELILYDGTRIAHDGVRFEVAPGSDFVAGFQLELLGVGVAAEGLPELADTAALEATERGWLYDARRGALHVRLAPADRGFVVERGGG